MDLVALLTTAISDEVSGFAINFLKAKGSEAWQAFRDKKSRKPVELYDAAYRMLRVASSEDLNRAATYLLKYYASALPVSVSDACFARYDRNGQTSTYLPLASRLSWVQAVEGGLSIESVYHSPLRHPLPATASLSHTPYRMTLGHQYSDGDIFSAREMNLTGDTLHLTFSETKFLPWRDRFGDLQDEFVMQIPKMFAGQAPTFNLRNALLPSLESVFDVSQRLNAGGVVVLTVFPNAAGDAEVLVEPRSGQVSDGQGLLTTIPRAFHDSFVRARGDYQPATTVFREIAEEIFGRDPHKAGQTTTDAYLMACEPVAELLDLKHFQLKPTGVMFDLLKGNYTLTYLLLVTDETWWRRYQSQQSMNEEFDGAGQATSFHLSWTDEIEELTLRSDWTFEGYYAFVEGLRALKPLAEKLNLNSRLIEYADRARDVLPDLVWVPAADWNDSQST